MWQDHTDQVYHALFGKEFSSQDQSILDKSSGTLTVRQYKSCSSMAADGRVEAAGHLGSHARLGHVTC